MAFLMFYDSESRCRMIITKVLQNRIKKILHTNHRRDLTRIKMREREHVYWPNMAHKFRSFMEQCEYCQIHMYSHMKKPLMPTEEPEYPFQKVAAD